MPGPSKPRGAKWMGPRVPGKQLLRVFFTPPIESLEGAGMLIYWKYTVSNLLLFSVKQLFIRPKAVLPCDKDGCRASDPSSSCRAPGGVSTNTLP